MALLLGGCGATAPVVEAPRNAGTASSDTPDPAESLALDFDDLTVEAVRDGPLWNVEDAPSGLSGVVAHTSTIDAGSISLVRGRDGGQALSFPAHDPKRTDRAVVTVTSDDPRMLDPGARPFRFGSAFSIDAASEGGLDNGNNLLQRGLWGEPAQFKIQIDAGIASCRIAGDRGELIASISTPVTPETWYDVSCERRRNSVLLELLGPGGQSTKDEVRGEIGSLTFADDTPVVIGGKVGPEGAPVVGPSDQFNGTVDDVHVRVAR